MPFTRPTLPQLLDTAQADVEARLPGADARAPRSILGVLARVVAGGLHGLYGYLGWLAEQVLPDTAEAEHLDRHGTIWGVGRKAAARATGRVTLTGAGVVPAGAALRTGDGRRYLLTAEALVDGSADLEVEAEVAGAAGNVAAAAGMSLVTPIAGVQSQGVVAAPGIAGGADTEADDDLRLRLLARIQHPPHGGAARDYVAWALEVEAVTRAWVSSGEMGPGTVTLRVMTDGIAEDGIPSEAVLDAVRAHVEAVRPVTAEVLVVPPVPVPFAVEISGLTPDTPSVRAAVEAEIADLVTRSSRPGGVILVSHLREAISRASGEADHVLVSPVADVSHDTGEIAVTGPVTWS